MNAAAMRSVGRSLVRLLEYIKSYGFFSVAATVVVVVLVVVPQYAGVNVVVTKFYFCFDLNMICDGVCVLI